MQALILISGGWFSMLSHTFDIRTRFSCKQTRPYIPSVLWQDFYNPRQVLTCFWYFPHLPLKDKVIHAYILLSGHKYWYNDLIIDVELLNLSLGERSVLFRYRKSKKKSQRKENNELLLNIDIVISKE